MAYYIDAEREQQIKKMEKLGIDTKNQLFEQMVNTALDLLEEANEHKKLVNDFTEWFRKYKIDKIHSEEESEIMRAEFAILEERAKVLTTKTE